MRLPRGWVAALLLTAVALAAVVIPLPLYVERPNTPVTLNGCVRSQPPAELTGEYLLMTISLYQASTIDAVAAWLEGDASVVDRDTVIPAGVDDATFFDDQARLFTSTADVATVVGMRGAGLDARIDGDGAAVVAVVPGGPADGVLVVGDVIVGVAGVAVSSDEELREVLREHPAGEPITVTFKRDGQTISEQVTPIEAEDRTLLGIEPQTLNPRATLPFDLQVDAGEVGGRSAGLTLALTVFDYVDDVDLAAGRRLAITGTITSDGAVGPVGGIALKAIAAERAGADLFLVPGQQLEAALTPLGPDSEMDVVGVFTFDEARDALMAAAPATAPTVAGTPLPQACA